MFRIKRVKSRAGAGEIKNRGILTKYKNSLNKKNGTT